MAFVAVAVVRVAVMAVVVGHGIARRCAPLFTQMVFLVVAAVVTLVFVGSRWWWWRCYVVVAWASAVALALALAACVRWSGCVLVYMCARVLMRV